MKQKRSQRQQLQTARRALDEKNMIGTWGNPTGWFALDDRKRFDWTVINSESHQRSKMRNSKTAEQGARTAIKEVQDI
jgi:hypothetical protein